MPKISRSILGALISSLIRATGELLKNMKKYNVWFYWTKSIAVGVIEAKNKKDAEQIAWDKILADDSNLLEELEEERFDIEEVQSI